MAISIGSLKVSNVIQYNNDLYTILTCEHAKLGRGPAFCRAKLKSIKNAQIINCTLRDSDNIKQMFTEKRKMQYLYADSAGYHFLDLETYEELVLSKERINGNQIWLRDNLELSGVFCNNNLIDMEFPAYITLKVDEVTPGIRGNTVKAGTKPAKLETGLIINVPLFIENNDTIKVDTSTKEYAGKT